MERYSILGNKVKLYRRQKGGSWHCYTFLKGKEWRKSTKQKSLALAKEVAEDWYLELRNKDRFGELVHGTTFEKAAKTFEREYEAITQGRRSPKWVQGHKDRIRLHLQPHFGKIPIKDISSGSSQEYRVYRMSKPPGWNDEENSTPKSAIIPSMRQLSKQTRSERWI